MATIPPYQITIVCDPLVGSAAQDAFVRQAIAALLRQVRQRQPAAVLVRTRLAHASDVHIAEVVLTLDLPLAVAIPPHLAQIGLARGPEWDRAAWVLAWSQSITELPDSESADDLPWLLESCDLVLAVGNGQPDGPISPVVAAARARGCPVLHIDPQQRTLTTETSAMASPRWEA